MLKPAPVMLRTAPALLLSIAIASGLAGCVAEPEEEEVAGEGADALRQGGVTSDREQVGRLRIVKNGKTFSCTATLVGPRSVLTAAHCVDYATKAVGAKTGFTGTFVTHGASWEVTRTRPFDGYVSYGRMVGAWDVALVHLREPITDLAPVRIASREPRWGDFAYVYGYGQNDCEAGGAVGSTDGKKRRYAYRWGAWTQALCKGDSGGPTFVDGEVVQVSSGTSHLWVVPSWDMFGHVWRLHDRLKSQIDAWR